MNEDEDYMSNDILNKCGDKRPGLLSKDAARKVQSDRRHQQLNLVNRTKSRFHMETESRQQALQTAITPDNKGFAMLQKMGYKPGMSLGKTGQDGRKEPVPLELKQNRTGLGHDKEVLRKRQASRQAMTNAIQKRQKLQQYQAQDYRSRKRNEMVEKLAEKDLYNSQKVCYQLDEQKGIQEPSEVFFWPAAATSKPVEDDGEERNDDSDVDDADTITSIEKLEILTLYLRGKHFYCVWCGTTFNDKEDMQQNCPGNTRQDHDD